MWLSGFITIVHRYNLPEIYGTKSYLQDCSEMDASIFRDTFTTDHEAGLSDAYEELFDICMEEGDKTPTTEP